MKMISSEQKQKIKQAFGRNYGNLLIEVLDAKGITPVKSKNWTTDIINDIVNGRSENIEAENAIFEKTIAVLKHKNQLAKKLNAV